MTAPSDFATRVGADLDAFVAAQRERLAPLGPRLGPFVDAATAATTGGKRLRAAFCHAGWTVGGGSGDDAAVVRASAALELLQASALVHDDVVDASLTRRGKPAAHAAFAIAHREAGWSGDPDAYGVGAAILLGDLLLSWSDEMFRTSGFSPDVVARATPYLDACKTEVVSGQFLDLVGQAIGATSVDEAMRIVRYKSAKYTVERPLHLGAALAGAGPETIDALSAYALPVGEAFQLRDDVLGVFGDPAVTGKPAGDDLREGKRTVLVAHAYSRADLEQRAALDLGLGDPDLTAAAVDRLRDVIRDTGALAHLEDDIAALEDQAAAALTLAPLAPWVEVLSDLAARAVRRNA
ncbi:polyprenyl synthetase family protein [Mumia zhuanghuii]|uniref:Polyprenyl synthetase family protein n=2 Tax=Mumia TaxID=1546255 RepID=A0ABW1QLB1_9ACTN|nr:MULTISPECIES: polyprenyl synthetase family protein [Mumia]KAA1423491.1 polyprenyl synthetase family protein [Mumia zhuanghuii]